LKVYHFSIFFQAQASFLPVVKAGYYC